MKINKKFSDLEGKRIKYFTLKDDFSELVISTVCGLKYKMNDSKFIRFVEIYNLSGLRYNSGTYNKGVVNVPRIWDVRSSFSGDEILKAEEITINSKYLDDSSKFTFYKIILLNDFGDKHCLIIKWTSLSECEYSSKPVSFKLE